MNNPWVTEVRRAVALLLISTLLGALLGQLMFVLLVALAGLFAWHAVQLVHFVRYFAGTKKAPERDSAGIWGELYYQVHRLRERNRKSKRRLTDLLGRFRESTSALPDGIVVLDSDGAIEWFNGRASKLLELNLQVDVGQRLDNLLRHPEFVSYMNATEYRAPLKLRSPVDGRTMLQFHIVPYGEKDQRLLIVRNITRTYQLEVTRRDFIANVSHELVTPLTVMSGYLESMNASRREGEGGWHSAVDQMQQQTMRMQHIVDDLLMLSRLELAEQVGDSAQINVAELCAELQSQAQALSGACQHVIKVEADETVQLLGDRKQLYSAFSNLVNNAVQYTPPGGDIQIRWYKDDSGGHFTVKDSGVGIPAQYIPRLTERFFRVDVSRSRSSGGTGLGLAIVKHILNLHNATLRIRSMPERGSTFTCNFSDARLVYVEPDVAPEISEQTPKQA